MRLPYEGSWCRCQCEVWPSSYQFQLGRGKQLDCLLRTIMALRRIGCSVGSGVGCFVGLEAYAPTRMELGLGLGPQLWLTSAAAHAYS